MDTKSLSTDSSGKIWVVQPSLREWRSTTEITSTETIGWWTCRQCQLGFTDKCTDKKECWVEFVRDWQICKQHSATPEALLVYKFGSSPNFQGKTPIFRWTMVKISLDPNSKLLIPISKWNSGNPEMSTRTWKMVIPIDQTFENGGWETSLSVWVSV